MSEFDWEGLLKLGISQLRLKPNEFWQLTPAELRMIVDAPTAAPLNRSKLADLMAAFPDSTLEQKDG